MAAESPIIGSELATYYAEGMGDISEAIQPGVKFALRYLRIHFRRLSGSGTATASLTIDIDSNRGVSWDHRLRALTTAGYNATTNADVNFRIEDDQLRDWAVFPPDRLVLNWTNPEANAVAWGLEARLVQLL